MLQFLSNIIALFTFYMELVLLIPFLAVMSDFILIYYFIKSV